MFSDVVMIDFSVEGAGDTFMSAFSKEESACFPFCGS